MNKMDELRKLLAHVAENLVISDEDEVIIRENNLKFEDVVPHVAELIGFLVAGLNQIARLEEEPKIPAELLSLLMLRGDETAEEIDEKMKRLYEVGEV